MTNEILVASDGLKLKRRSWQPEKPARAIVIIAHGYGEYAGRYASFASQLNAAGYAVESIDARGHGESEGPRVFIKSIDDLGRDFGRLCDQLIAQSNVPVFILGHSLGTLVTIKTISGRQDKIAGLILSGNALDGQSALPRPVIKILHVLARILPKLRLLPALSAKDISTDPEIVRAYQNDPLVERGRWRVMTGSATMKAIKACRELLADIKVPLYIMHGEDDQMLSVAGAHFAMQHAGSTDKTLSIYPGEYHEPLSGITKDKVIRDLIAWLNNHING